MSGAEDRHIHVAHDHAVWRGQRVRLPPSSLRVLSALGAARGRVLSAGALIDIALYGRDISPNNVHVHVMKLRAAFGRDLILTERALGFRLGPEWRVTSEPAADEDVVVAIPARLASRVVRAAEIEGVGFDELVLLALEEFCGAEVQP